MLFVMDLHLQIVKLWRASNKNVEMLQLAEIVPSYSSLAIQHEDWIVVTTCILPEIC